MTQEKMRVFGKATRDTDADKLDFDGFLSPQVLHRFAEYMNKNRHTKMGVRDSDNWQHLFGEEHLQVCMKSGHRHFMDWWLFHRGLKGRDDIESSICGLIFNAQAYLFKLLNDRNYLK